MATEPTTIIQKTSEDVSKKQRIKMDAASTMAIFLQGKTGYTVEKLISGTKTLAAYLEDDTK